MLKKSTKLFDEAQNVKADGTNLEQAWHRGGELHMLGVNYRWSSIVLDKRTPKETAPVDPYGVTCTDMNVNTVRAGERAPDAPGLVRLDSVHSAQATTSLLDIFRPSYHTVLIFSDGTDKAGRMVSTMKAYPAGLLRTVLIHSDSTTALSNNVEVDFNVVDRDGHAHDGYQVAKDEFITFIVRPDSVVGGVVSRIHEAKQYFDGILGSTQLMAHI